MLYVIADAMSKFIERGDIVYQVSLEFSACWEEEWLNTDFAKRIIKDIDDKNVDDGDTKEILWHIYGMRPTELCGGTKALILIQSTDFLISMSMMGPNCYKYLFELAHSRDRRVALTSFTVPRDSDFGGTKVFFENTGCICTSEHEFWASYRKVRKLLD